MQSIFSKTCPCLGFCFSYSDHFVVAPEKLVQYQKNHPALHSEHFDLQLRFHLYWQVVSLKIQSFELCERGQILWLIYLLILRNCIPLHRLWNHKLQEHDGKLFIYLNWLVKKTTWTSDSKFTVPCNFV